MGKVIFAAAALVILFVLLVNVLYYYKNEKNTHPGGTWISKYKKEKVRGDCNPKIPARLRIV